MIRADVGSNVRVGGAAVFRARRRMGKEHEAEVGWAKTEPKAEHDVNLAERQGHLKTWMTVSDDKRGRCRRSSY
jgi:hypothetical protein